MWWEAFFCTLQAHGDTASGNARGTARGTAEGDDGAVSICVWGLDKIEALGTHVLGSAMRHAGELRRGMRPEMLCYAQSVLLSKLGRAWQGPHTGRAGT